MPAPRLPRNRRPTPRLLPHPRPQIHNLAHLARRDRSSRPQQRRHPRRTPTRPRHRTSPSSTLAPSHARTIHRRTPMNTTTEKSPLPHRSLTAASPEPHRRPTARVPQNPYNQRALGEVSSRTPRAKRSVSHPQPGTDHLRRSSRSARRARGERGERPLNRCCAPIPAANAASATRCPSPLTRALRDRSPHTETSPKSA